jgi:hypothetical protein
MDHYCLYKALDYVTKAKAKVITEVFSLGNINESNDKVDNGNIRPRA